MPDSLEFSKMSDDEVKKVLQENKIGLSVDEARKIETILGRAPTLTEAVMWGIQGSEHCSYRSTRPYLATFSTDAPNVILGPVEDAGVVEIARDGDDRWGLIMSHESHNHPSQIVPYEGAATGIGGNVRDVTCMGGRVIGVLDPLRFGNPENHEAKLIANEVVRGIAGYGNPIGVPNLGGDINFGRAFDDNCLVNVLTLGLVKESEIIHSFVPEEAGRVGYDIIIVGKPADNSGMGGAAFASLELNEDDKEANKGAVQEPNPFLKRHLMASTYDLFDKLKEMDKLDKVGFKDMGAGGNMCATVELVDKVGLGAEIDLEKIPVAMEGLHPSVIACSETQERFAWMCHPDLTDMIVDHYNTKWELGSVAENARAAVVGKVTEGGQYVLRYHGTKVCDAKANDITEGLKYERKVEEKIIEASEPEIDVKDDTIMGKHHPKATLSELTLELMASPNIASRHSVYNRYDKNVQGNTIIEAGEADAGVIAPLLEKEGVSKEKQLTGVAVTTDGISRYSKLSPYWQAANAVVEAMRNVACVGATPQALTDCLNYNNPEVPELMWEFAQGVEGIKAAAKGIPLKEYPEFDTPIISGNVSLYNTVDASAIIGCAGTIADFNKAITPQLKAAGNKLYLLGDRRNELGASEFYNILGELGANIPTVNFEEAKKEIYTVIDAIDAELLASCHDISEGGLVAALAEMTMPHPRTGGGELGVKIDLAEAGPEGMPFYQKAFSENGGFIIEVGPNQAEGFEALCKNAGINAIELGEVTAHNEFLAFENGEEMINVTLADLQNAWLNSLAEVLK